MTSRIESDLCNQLVRQTGLWVICSTWRISSTLFTHIPQVIGLRSKEHVQWIDATRVVAAMTNNKTKGNWPYNEFVGNPMGKVKMPVVAHDLAIPTLLGRRKPRPARFRITYIDLFPETLGQGS